jgi:hypothetical protein
VLSGAGHRDLVPLNTCYVATGQSEAAVLAACAWLNSGTCRAIAALAASAAAGGFRRFAAATVAALPFPSRADCDAKLAALARAAANGDDVTDALDDRVTELLGLGTDDRAALAAVACGGPGDRR